jgi:hypothetical protein
LLPRYTAIDSNALQITPQSDGILTLLNAVLLGALVVLILLLAGDTLDALVEVVLVGSALSGVGALWTRKCQ